MSKLMGLVWVPAFLLTAFLMGTWEQSRRHGECSIYTNVDEHTESNHGQKYIHCELPSGVRINQIKLPDGYWYPGAEPRLVEILPDGTEKTWLDHLEFEATFMTPAS